MLEEAFSVIVKTDGSFAALPCMQHFFSGNVEIPLNFTFATDLKKNPTWEKSLAFFVNQQNIRPVFLTSFMQKVLKGFKIIISLQTGLVVTFQSTKGL